jgi:hypothetical protein
MDINTKMPRVTIYPLLRLQQSASARRKQATADPVIKKQNLGRTRDSTQEQVITHFSVHDAESTKPRIVLVNADRHQQQEENLRAKYHAVVKEPNVCVQPQARLYLGFPNRTDLQVSISMERWRHRTDRRKGDSHLPRLKVPRES